jgi:nitrilase
MAKALVAAIQMVSAPDVATNLAAAERLIAQASAAGARLAALPENFYLIGQHEGDKVKVREPDGRGPIQDFLSTAARKHGVWIVGGTAPIECGENDRILSASLVFDDSGRRVARYDKMHLFRFDGDGERYDESRTLQPGARAVALDSPFGRLALSICYDVRFPELYRALGSFDVMFVPSAFTVPTGRAHWEILLRARAVENQAYVVAPAQAGLHPSGRRTYGHSMVVDPWGDVLAQREDGEAVVLAEIDTERIREVRRSLPALLNRRLN